jgi:hypothetical protein
MNTNLTDLYKSISHSDIHNDEILFTFYKEATVDGFTVSFNEPIDAFVSFYGFVPTIYIPYKHRYLTTTSSIHCAASFDRNLLFLHDSDLVTSKRCNFYGAYVDSTIELLFNPEYDSTKVFDNLFFISNSSSTTADIFYDTFDHLKCYNDYQYTGDIPLVYNTNLKRRERTWTTVVPRNIVSSNVSTDPNKLTAVLATQLFKERMRDKYLIVHLTYHNLGTYDRFSVSNIGLSYRSSIR